MFTDRPKLGDPSIYAMECHDEAAFVTVGKYFDIIEEMAKVFLADKEGVEVSIDDEMGTYTNAPKYFYETLSYHKDIWVQDYLTLVLKETSGLGSVVDMGCAFGITGLCFTMQQKMVTFHDYPGIGLDFISFVKEHSDLGKYITVIPYGEPVRQHKLCLAFDVLEHIPSVHSALYYFKEIGDVVAMTYPCRVPRRAPFEKEGLDRWLDDELIQRTLMWRYQLRYSHFAQGWRSCIFN
jgi:hypothetical protein